MVHACLCITQWLPSDVTQTHTHGITHTVTLSMTSQPVQQNFSKDIITKGVGLQLQQLGARVILVPWDIQDQCHGFTESEYFTSFILKRQEHIQIIMQYSTNIQ